MTISKPYLDGMHVVIRFLVFVALIRTLFRLANH
jgi:hypothetical protein